MIFQPAKKVLCPYCLAEIRYRKEISQCPKAKGGCGSELNSGYVQASGRAQPCFLQIMGWSQHGKTVFLQALTLMIQNLGMAWREGLYAFSPQTKVTKAFLEKVDEAHESGSMPERTQLETQDAYIMLLNNMKRWGSRTLVARDVAGEHFDHFTFPEEQIPYVLNVPTTLMMFSKHDLIGKPYGMDSLMTSYQNTLREKIKWIPEQQPRKVVVVLSKADLLADILPDTLKDYLVNDPLQKILTSPGTVTELDAAFMQNYMQKLAWASQEIEKWVDQEPRGHNLIQLARINNIHLSFSIISSTGTRPGDDNKMATELQPRRVLDPFFWALEYQSTG
jgi:hypothetical protein